MRPPVRWPGATLRPATLWPQLRPGPSAGSPPILPDSSSLALLKKRPMQAQKSCQEPAVGHPPPKPLIQQVMGEVGSHGLQYPRLGHPSQQALNALTDPASDLPQYKPNRQQIIFVPGEARQAPRLLRFHSLLPCSKPKCHL